TDPVLSAVKLIAEPWDVGPGGWRTGQFPAPMAEWNDKFRDALRTFWITDAAALAHDGAGGDLRELDTRLSGSADLFSPSPAPEGRGPNASINYVTAHDGFTLADLVGYDHKHNEANGEENQDGTDNNLSWNHGVEGPTDGARCATCSAPCCWPAALRCSPPGTRSGAASRATTTPTARTRRCPGWTGTSRSGRRTWPPRWPTCSGRAPRCPRCARRGST